MIGCVMWLSVVCAPAQAYEDQVTLGVGLGYAYATRSDQPHHGATVTAFTTLGLGPSWSARGLFSYGLHPAQASRSRLDLAAELLYLIDVVELVPYVGAGIDALGTWTEGGPSFRPDFALHPVVGADWLVSRDLLIGLDVRPLFVLTDAKRELLYLNVMLTGSLALDL
jgi:hypothetical protein